MSTLLCSYHRREGEERRESGESCLDGSCQPESTASDRCPPAQPTLCRGDSSLTPTLHKIQYSLSYAQDCSVSTSTRTTRGRHSAHQGGARRSARSFRMRHLAAVDAPSCPPARPAAASESTTSARQTEDDIDLELVDDGQSSTSATRQRYQCPQCVSSLRLHIDDLPTLTPLIHFASPPPLCIPPHSRSRAHLPLP